MPALTNVMATNAIFSIANELKLPSPAAWLARAGDAAEFFRKVTELGLRIRAGATFYIFSTADLPMPEGFDGTQIAPFAPGYSLFLY